MVDFYAEKSPTTDMDAVLVIAHYLQNVLKLENYGPGHILTGFNHVGKPIPVDLPATIRNLKRKVWFNFNDIQEIRVATEGDNRVKHRLPRNSSSSS